jgi:hypothetical protein
MVAVKQDPSLLLQQPCEDAPTALHLIFDNPAHLGLRERVVDLLPGLKGPLLDNVACNTAQKIVWWAARQPLPFSKLMYCFGNFNWAKSEEEETSILSACMQLAAWPAVNYVQLMNIRNFMLDTPAREVAFLKALRTLVLKQASKEALKAIHQIVAYGFVRLMGMGAQRLLVREAVLAGGEASSLLRNAVDEKARNAHVEPRSREEEELGPIRWPHPEFLVWRDRGGQGVRV